MNNYDLKSYAKAVASGCITMVSIFAMCVVIALSLTGSL